MQEKNLIPAQLAMPMRLPVIALLNKPIFPGIFLPMMINTPADLRAVELAEEAGGFVGLLLVKESHEETRTKESFYEVGVVAKIMKKVNLPDGSLNIFIATQKRFRVVKFVSKEVPFVVAVKYLDEIGDKNSNELKAMVRSLLQEMKSVSENNPFFNEEIRLNMLNIDEPGKIADVITSMLNIDREKLQEMVEILDIKERLERALMFIKREQEVSRIQQKVSKQLNERIEKSQREYFLREELKAIKAELGENNGDPKSMEVERFREAIAKLELTGEVKEQVERELEKFTMIEPNSSEYSVIRNYLDLIITLPWHATLNEAIDLAKGRQILDEDHYGLEDVKERILEYLAVRKLKQDAKGSIICLVGPPGVGKTSIGRSIARALGREFFRFSVGGMRDEAEIKGHRRTYVGAMPGKFIQGMKVVKSRNPVFMIDEIDKLGVSYQGDPAGALLEVLDPEQNATFRDNYLDLPFDLSDVMFIATANTLDTIPHPLLDRMEVIRLSGYTEDEKVEIAKRYIIPKSLKKSGLDKTHVRYDRSALKAIALGYAREAGMRHYEQLIDRIHRKVAKKVALNEAEELPIKITESSLEIYLKRAPFKDEETKKITRPGMVVGLAWTAFGGDTLMIEAVALPGKGGLQLTGQMGDVMKESATIAYTYARLYLANKGKDSDQRDFFDKHTIHLHIPAGATPKDGPSAGITMASAMISLALGKQVKKGLAMTGELSLVGNVLAIGGLKEKSLAARRLKIKEVIIPKANTKDLQEIPEHVKENILFHPVDRMDKVIELLFSEE
ncbi:endopeptidase La [Entomospira culicis]|uniref:Lon protease n=1 Tax=Entomospira culicis TaxID=2719989 RepID=A0A968GGX1_9SPIO|nr:endopeptidase La [Entomospira culicis]NIZ19654.1 endopeptidase La [Entomospira culicis]NIZ69868.1 endopeptidase La [Entomospira culicis]WDI37976.1 endopeptidase La [Entomospira culicis]WDI39599.1 endopeptidase La [Entomospira culicis]